MEKHAHRKGSQVSTFFKVTNQTHPTAKCIQPLEAASQSNPEPVVRVKRIPVPHNQPCVTLVLG